MINILYVDDKKNQIFSIKTAFEDLYGEEYKIIPAESGKKCLDLLTKNIIPDLILLDIMMPDMNGWEVFDKLKANPKWKNIPVVFLTARTDGFAEQTGEFIAEDYIKKPIDVKELKIRIDNILKKVNK
jgi:CheY-like chemotaxis protein